MSECELEAFSSISLSEPPPATRCLPLRPCGLGTGIHESFPSYLQRLALAHGLTSQALLRQEVFPRLGLPWSAARLFLLCPRTTLLVAGSGDLGEQIISAVAELTGFPGLIGLRHPHFGARFPYWRLQLRPHLAWCPLCLSEWRAAGQPLCFPLLWAFRPVRCCPVHRTPLVEACSCGRQFRHLSTRPWLPSCLGCKASLLEPPVSAPAPWEIEVASAMQELLSWLGELASPLPLLLVRNLRAAVAALGGTQVFADRLGLSLTMVQKWTGPRTKAPLLPSLLRLRLAFEIPLADWFEKELPSSSFSSGPHLPADVPCLQPWKRFLPPEEIEPQLRAALLAPAPVSLLSFSRAIGSSPENVSRACPELSRQLAARYLRFIRFRRLSKDANRAALVREAIAHFEHIGMPFVASQAKVFLGARWTESHVHLAMVHRRILAGDPRYSLSPAEVLAFS